MENQSENFKNIFNFNKNFQTKAEFDLSNSAFQNQIFTFKNLF